MNLTSLVQIAGWFTATCRSDSVTASKIELCLMSMSVQVNELFHLWDSHVVQDLKRVLLESDQDSSTRTVARESLEAVQKMEAATAASARSWSAIFALGFSTLRPCS